MTLASSSPQEGSWHDAFNWHPLLCPRHACGLLPRPTTWELSPIAAAARDTERRAALDRALATLRRTFGASLHERTP